MGDVPTNLLFRERLLKTSAGLHRALRRKTPDMFSILSRWSGASARATEISVFLVDANVIVGWLLSRPAPVAFVERLRTEDDLLAARLLLPECTSVLRAEVYEDRIQPRDAQRLLARV